VHVPSPLAHTQFSEKDFLHTASFYTSLLLPNSNLAIAVFSRFPITNNFPKSDEERWERLPSLLNQDFFSTLKEENR